MTGQWTSAAAATAQSTRTIRAARTPKRPPSKAPTVRAGATCALVRTNASGF